MAADRAYFDHNAGAPLRPQALAAMVEALGEVGNASSVHQEGRAAHRRIEHARMAVARLVGADQALVTFTAGGTEANVTALTPDWTLDGRPHRCDLLLVGATEHPSVLAGGRFVAEAVRTVPVDGDGIADLAALRAMLAEAAGRGARVLVSLMLANNETGVLQPVAEAAALAHEYGALCHTDAAQACGRVPVDIAGLGVDVMTVSAHKIGGPQGAGALVRASGRLAARPLLTGGGQEKRMRAGTENVAAAAGFGAAAEAALADLGRAAEWMSWRRELAGIVAEAGPARVFSSAAPRLPQTLCVGVAGLPAETVVIALDLAGVAVSSGAACSSGKVSPSHVLAAMGVPADVARTAIRISFGWETRAEHLNLFRAAWQRATARMAAGGARAA